MALRGSYKRNLVKRLANEQGGKCCYCRRPFTKDGPTRPTLEHKKARMDGGKDKVSNFAVACLHCNQLRGRQMNTARQAKTEGSVTWASPEQLECIHCGQMFFAYQSRYAEYGMCEGCDSD